MAFSKAINNENILHSDQVPSIVYLSPLINLSRQFRKWMNHSTIARLFLFSGLSQTPVNEENKLENSPIYIVVG